MKLYWKYAHVGATWIGLTILIISTLTATGLLRFVDAWLSIWTADKELRKMSNITFNVLESEFPSSKTNLRIEEFNAINYYYLIVFCSSVAGLILFTSIMICRFFIMCINASKKLHNQMFSRILRAPSTFFQVNRKGIILNRFSKDIGCMDELLPITFHNVFLIMLQILGIISYNW